MEIKQRDTYFDFLRGVAMILVIGIHTYSDGLMHLNLLMRQFLNCAVPLFLAISGYFVGKKSFTEKGAYTLFLKKQIPRVYIPMLFWSLPWAVVAFKGGDSMSHTIILVLTGSMCIYYFIILIMQYYVLTPFIQKVVKTTSGGVVCGIITLIGISAFKYFVTIQQLPLSMVASGSPFPVWLVFFALGVSAAQGLIIKTSVNKLVTLSLVSIVLCFAECLLTHEYFGSWNPGIKPTSHLYSLLVLLLIFQSDSKLLYEKIRTTPIDKFICYIGRVSFFIYLTHMLILGYGAHILASIWIIHWVITIFLSVVFAFIVDKIAPYRLKKYIGF